MKTVLEMAREAGMQGMLTDVVCTHNELMRFAELVRADEREKYDWDVHSCGPTCQRYACVAMREALEVEREACVKAIQKIGQHGIITQCVAAIRARRTHEHISRTGQ